MRHHKTRHDFARVLLQAGIPIEEVATMFGHKSSGKIRDQYAEMLELERQRALLLPRLEEERVAYDKFREALARGESDAPIPQYSDEASFQEMTLQDEISHIAQEIYESLKTKHPKTMKQSSERRFVGYFLSFDHALSAMLAESGNDQTLKELEIRHGETDFAPDCEPFYVFADYCGERIEYLFIQQSGKTVEEMRRVDS